MKVTMHQEPSEIVLDHGIRKVCVDQGELWSTTFRNLCLSMSVKVTASPTQHHTDNAFAECAIQTIQKIARSLLYDTGMNERWWPHTIAQAAFIHNCLAAYVVLRGNTCSMWLRDHPVVSKHLCPCALQGTYLGFSNAPRTIKGHKVWLPELNCIVVTRDICFSEFEQLGTDTNPSYTPVFAGNSKLLRSVSGRTPETRLGASS
ncbi:uncharacterized protein UBRO_20431 [Ustilago bromivora]|uniref:Integrase catalytic domain-containing protein n=1 Tax=Ustilago bromivora TaxID=307758 RepID=A0A1K0H5B9_9BASI|nr:uncharacterized protein UBRO_20431 [Ustilago bromivora]